MRNCVFSLFCIVFLAFAGVSSIEAQDDIIVPAGNDHWITQPRATGEFLSVPKDFFGQGSLPYEGFINYKGDPRSGVEYDTSVRRERDVTVPGGTSLKVVELYLRSEKPLEVLFANGSVGECDLYVELSPSLPSTGKMTINKRDWQSNLTVVPMYRSVCRFGSSLAGGEITTVRDLGTPMMQLILRTRANQAKQNLLSGSETTADKMFASMIPAEDGGVYGAHFSSSGNKWKLVNNSFKSVMPDKSERIPVPRETESVAVQPCQVWCNYVQETNGYFCHCVQTYPLEPGQQIPFSEPAKP